jgi:site-specific recombinase XerD
MKPCIIKILGSHVLGAKTLALLSATRAPNTSTTYGSVIRRYFDVCQEHRLATPLATTPAHMARYVAWLGHLGTIRASSLQPHLSVINGFFKDCGLEVIALDDLVANIRK